MSKKGKTAAPEAPRDWFHYNAKQAEALDRMERRLRDVETRVGITGAGEPEMQQAEAQALQERYTHPAGVVPPHVALNYRALLEWTEPHRWQGANQAALLAHLHQLIGVAAEGGDVPRP